jgi:hypothetical protein
MVILKMSFTTRVIPAFVTVTVLMVATAQADMTDSDTKINADIVKASNQLAVGFGILHQDYREFNDGLVPSLPTILDSESGDLTSLRLSFTGMVDRLYVQGSLGYSTGDTAYTGYLQQFGPPIVYTPLNTTTSNHMLDLIGRVGYTYKVGSSVAVIPYIELGEHVWKRDVAPSAPYGVTEDYFHFSLGFGAKALYSPIERLVLEIGAGYGSNLLSTTTTGGYDFKLGDKPYVNAYASLDYRIDNHWHLTGSADYRKWEYGESDMVAGLVEPHSETQQTQYLMSVGYHF